MTTLEKLEELVCKDFKEIDERLAQHWKEINEELARHRKETDEHIDRRIQEAERRRQEIRPESGGSSEWSDQRFQREMEWMRKEIGLPSVSGFIERAVLPAATDLFRERAIELNRVYANYVGHFKREVMETDILGLGPKCAVLIEVESRLELNDVKEFLTEKLPRFFDFFPDCRRLLLYGGVGGMSLGKGVEQFACEKGLFVIGETRGDARILNDEKFKPRSFAVAQINRFPKRKSKSVTSNQ